MPSRSSSRTRPWLVGPLAAALALVVSGTVLSVPAYAANPVTPGNYRGLGFDQCEAPSQSAMSTWIKKSPFRAAGIYISGASRGCPHQPNLTPRWVRRQLANGWRLLPITLGPQASWQPRFPRYQDDPKINPKRGTDGRWLLENQHPGTMAVEVDKGEGQPSRWNTLRALRVLDWYSARD